MSSVAFTVHGIAAPQGSKTRTNWGVREDNPNTKPWRATVTAAAAEAMNGKPLLTGPVELSAVFYFPRPKAHYRTGRHAHELRPDAPFFHSVKPDTDKLLRAIGDAITGQIVHDDSQIARLGQIDKRYGEPARAVVAVAQLSAPPPPTAKEPA